MEKVKPVLPPKPKCSSPFQGNRSDSVDSTGKVELTACDSALVTSDELDGGWSADGKENLSNGEALHMTSSHSMEDICHGFPRDNAEQVRKQRPRTAPKPKSRFKTDLGDEVKMISSRLIADALAVFDSSDSDISLVDGKTENMCEAKVSPNVAVLKSKHGLVVASSNQLTTVPVKPPRPKKTQKQASLCTNEAALESPPSAEQGGENHDDEKKQSRRMNVKTKPKTKPKLFVNVQEPNNSLNEEGKRSPASADSGRLHRSASYERALDDDIFSSEFREHVKDNGEEEVKGQTADAVLCNVKTSVSYTDVSGNCLGAEHIKAEGTVVAKERVLGNVLGDGKSSGSIQPIRLAPPPPSKPNAPLLKRIQKDSGFTGVLPDYMDLQSKNCSDPDASVVKRSISDRSGKKSLPTEKPSKAKQKMRKKLAEGGKGKSEDGRHSESVFYVNLGNTTSGLNEKNLAIDRATHCEVKPRMDSDEYLLPVVDSSAVSASGANSDSVYENVEVSTTKTRNLSLDTKIPLPGRTLEPVQRIEPDNISNTSINTYYEISELDIPVLIHTEDGALDDEGYSMIAENSNGRNNDRENADTEYMYPENWSRNAQPSRVSDTYIYPVDESEKAFSPKSAAGEKSVAVVRPRTTSDLSFLSEESDSRRSSCAGDSTFESPTFSSTSLSRSSSAVSNNTMQMTDGELTEEDIKRNAEKRKRKAFLTAQEMVTSEKTFVDVLRLLSQDFMAAVNQASVTLGKQVISSSVLSQIIKYLPELQKFNEELLEDLTSRLKNWEKDPRVADIFVKKGAFLKLYTNYIREFNSMVALLDENRRKNPDFDRTVTEFEASHCAKLALKHYMLKPIQRIPQYRLLLGDYRKQLSEDSSDFKDAETAILIVNEVAEHANESMKYGDNLNKLLDIQNSLIGQFEVIVPGRTLLKEGILMKLSRKEMQPRMFYLFSDVLLYTTPVGSGYKLNNVLALNTMKVSAPTKEDFQNEFSIISIQRSFTVSARTEQEKVEWLAAMSQAISSIQMKRTSYSTGRRHVPSIVSIDIDPMDFKLGTKAPVWIPDDRVSMCMICKQEFSLLFRRHHCRGCGKVVCSPCSSYEAPLRYLQYKPERVCSECYLTLDRMTDEMPDTIPEEDTMSPQGEQVAESIRFTKRSIKNQFRSFAVDSGSPKYVPPKRPAVLQEVNASDEQAEMSGYLHLWKDRKWKKTWFVLKEKVLYTFKASEDAAAEKSTPLLGYEITPFNTYFQGVEPNMIFELCHRGMPSVIFRTESPQSRDRWMSAMRSATMP